MDVVLGVLSGAIIGAVVMVFVYRNNAKLIGKYADRVDEVYDKLEELKELFDKKQ